MIIHIFVIDHVRHHDCGNDGVRPVITAVVPAVITADASAVITAVATAVITTGVTAGVM